jgi:protocatechuate 3,4-dioxygenase beta subunit
MMITHLWNKNIKSVTYKREVSMIKKGIMFVSVFALCIGAAFAASDLSYISSTDMEARTTITGTVVDANTEAPIPNAQIAVREADASTTSDEAGTFTFVDLEPGTYTLSVSADGYEAAEVRVEVSEEGAIAEVELNPQE